MSVSTGQVRYIGVLITMLGIAIIAMLLGIFYESWIVQNLMILMFVTGAATTIGLDMVFIKEKPKETIKYIRIKQPKEKGK